MKNKFFEQIVAYYKGELSALEQKEMNLFFVENPTFLCLLRGLANIESKVPPGQTIEQFMLQKQNQIMKSIFTQGI